MNKRQLLAQQPRNIFAQAEVERADGELNRVYTRVKSALATKPSALVFGRGSGQPEVGGSRESLLTRERIASLLLILAGPREPRHSGAGSHFGMRRLHSGGY